VGHVPFADKEIFFGSIMNIRTRGVSLIPIYRNCGMARVLPIFNGRSGGYG